jgi:ribosomal protein S18 acetylase RimI-like enzyme
MINHVDIIEFSDELSVYVKTLNYEWLEKYFRVEKGDKISLENPKREIIEKGGQIFFIKLNYQIVGTVSLIKKYNTVFELGKMAITSSAQGHGLGQKLLEHCLKFSEEQGIKKLILYSNTQLKTALHLYKKFGFYEVDLEPGLYERADIKLERKLQ